MGRREIPNEDSAEVVEVGNQATKAGRLRAGQSTELNIEVS